MNEEQYTLNTRKFANLLGVAPEAVRNRYYRYGSYYGVIPRRFINGRLSWPDVGYILDEASDEPNRTGLINYEPKFACCGNCKFYWPDEMLGGIDDDHECRRYPPTFIFEPGTTNEAYVFPLMSNEKWCGEWQKKS